MEGRIPDRSPGPAPAHQGSAGTANLLMPAAPSIRGVVVVRRIRGRPAPAGDKPPRYIFSFRLRPSVYNSAHQGMTNGGWWRSFGWFNGGFESGVRHASDPGMDRQSGCHLFVRMTRVGIYSRTNDTHETGPPKSEQLQVAEIDLTMEQSMLCCKNNRINPRDREQR